MLSVLYVCEYYNILKVWNSFTDTKIKDRKTETSISQKSRKKRIPSDRRGDGQEVRAQALVSVCQFEIVIPLWPLGIVLAIWN